MLEIEELTGSSVGTSEVACITPKVIAAAFEEIVHLKCVWAQFYRPNRDIYNKPGKEVVFPGATAAGGFTIGVPEKTDIRDLKATVGIETYTCTTISLKKIGGYLDVTREAIKFAMRDVLRDNIYETGMQYKEIIDNAAYYNLMHGGYTIAAEESETMPTGSSIGTLTKNVIQINSIVPAGAKQTIDAIDYCNGTIYFKSSMDVGTTIYFREGQTPGLCVSAARPGSTATGVTAWGLLSGKAAMIAQGREPDVAVLSYSDLPNLLYDEKVNFLDASAYTSHEPLYNAEVGKLWGMKIVTESRRLPQGCAILIDKDRMGYDVHKQDLTSYRDDVYEKDAVSYYFYSERGFGVMDTLALCKVVGGTPDYPATYPVN